MVNFGRFLAVKDAISAVGDHEIQPEFSLPAINEVILLSVEKIKKEMKSQLFNHFLNFAIT